MKLIFFGTPEWAVPTLEAVAAAHDVLGVVTAPDAPQGRSKTPVAPPVKTAALRLGAGPVLQPASLREAVVRSLVLERAPDALVVVAYGRILPGRMLDAPRHGAINVHFSLLPRWRGASPVQHTILAGDREGGVTTMKMDRGLDTGPVLQQRATNIERHETSSTLGARLAVEGAALLLSTLDGLLGGTLVPRPQFEPVASHAPLLRKEDGFVRWDASAPELERRVRAFDPWPPVTCTGARGPLRLLEAEARDERADAEPGTVVARAGDAIDVACGGATRLRIARVQPSGGKPMTAAAALAGRYLTVGERLGDGGTP